MDKKKRSGRLSTKFKILLVIIFCLLTWLVAVLIWFPFMLGIKLMRIAGSGTSYACGSNWKDTSINTFFKLKFCLIFLLPYIVICISSFKLLIFLVKWKKKEGIINNNGNSEALKTVRLETASLAETERRLSTNSKPGLGLKWIRHIISQKKFHVFDGEKQEKQQNVSNEHQLSRNKSECIESESSNENIIDDPQQPNQQRPFIVRLHIVQNNTTVTNKRTNKSHNKGGLYISNVRQKAIRLVLIIILLYFLQWTPLLIFQLTVLYSNQFIPNIQLINLIISTLSYSNTIANPVLYMFLTYNFKQYCRKTLRQNRTIQCILARRRQSS